MSVFGHAKKRLEGKQAPMSQHCVCFTETPLEHTHLLLADIENRTMHFEPYGIAITKRVGRRRTISKQGEVASGRLVAHHEQSFQGESTTMTIEAETYAGRSP